MVVFAPVIRVHFTLWGCLNPVFGCQQRPIERSATAALYNFDYR